MTRLNNKFIYVFVSILVSVSADCSFKYEKDFPDKESVLLWYSKGEYELIEPKNDGIVLKKNEKIAVTCPGARNSIADVDEKLVLAQCVKGQILKVEGTKYLLSELGCSAKVTGEFSLSKDACGTSGIIKHIGYNVEDDFHTLIDICYDDKIGGALYSDHLIYGSAISYSRSVRSRPGFKVGGVAKGVSANTCYKQTTQKSTFATILGSKSLASKYIHRNSYLARGHLAPVGDMVFVSSKFSTSFYINTVPQWQKINNGNWKSLEKSLRNVASRLRETFQVFTGSHEVLALRDKNGNLAEIYLSKCKLPVPKFVWKVFYSLKTQKGIAFVSVNNPFVEEVTAEHYLCEDICDEYAWGTKAWKNPSRGLLYCCEIDDLRRAVPNVPELDVRDVQKADVAVLLEISKD